MTVIKQAPRKARLNRDNIQAIMTSPRPRAHRRLKPYLLEWGLFRGLRRVYRDTLFEKPAQLLNQSNLVEMMEKDIIEKENLNIKMSVAVQQALHHISETYLAELLHTAGMVQLESNRESRFPLLLPADIRIAQEIMQKKRLDSAPCDEDLLRKAILKDDSQDESMGDETEEETSPNDNMDEAQQEDQFNNE